MTFPPAGFHDSLPKPSRLLNIGLVGCGEIANIAHLPAYQNAGFPVIACYDINPKAAEETAHKFGIPLVYQTLDELLENPLIDIVDIAFHVSGRLEVISASAQAGKHLLVQKPLAHSLEDARVMVRLAQTHHVKLQVNQQARWAGTFQLVKACIAEGLLGELNFLSLHVTGWQDDPNKWYSQQPNFTIVDHGIHYLDLLRFWAGKEPKRVMAIHSRPLHQVSAAPLVYSVLLDFGPHLHACHSFNDKCETQNPWTLSARIDGERGTLWADYHTVRIQTKKGDSWEYTPKTQWFPDAFAGPMADLMDAILYDREPLCSGRDNLHTLALTLSAQQSANTGSFIPLDFTGSTWTTKIP
ncbi:MAG: Gfo/Idh/MocA family oxidoreductase [Candidatus Caldarchaeum sp.]